MKPLIIFVILISLVLSLFRETVISIDEVSLTETNAPESDFDIDKIIVSEEIQ